MEHGLTAFVVIHLTFLLKIQLFQPQNGSKLSFSALEWLNERSLSFTYVTILIYLCTHHFYSIDLQSDRVQSHVFAIFAQNTLISSSKYTYFFVIFVISIYSPKYTYFDAQICPNFLFIYLFILFNIYCRFCSGHLYFDPEPPLQNSIKIF